MPIEGGYATPANYLASGGSFTSDSRFAIDSLIWVTNGKKIAKYNKGNSEGFDISGIPGEIGELGPIYTSSAIDNLYVIDKLNSAILVIDKDGNYKKALQAPEFSKATDIAVPDTEDKVLISVDSKVLSASLK